MKLDFSLGQYLDFKGRALGGAWVEIPDTEGPALSLVGRALGGAWVEIQPYRSGVYPSRVAPLGARGLKSCKLWTDISI